VVSVVVELDAGACSVRNEKDRCNDGCDDLQESSTARGWHEMRVWQKRD